MRPLEVSLGGGASFPPSRLPPPEGLGRLAPPPDPAPVMFSFIFSPCFRDRLASGAAFANDAVACFSRSSESLCSWMATLKSKASLRSLNAMPNSIGVILRYDAGVVYRIS